LLLAFAWALPEPACLVAVWRSFSFVRKGHLLTGTKI